MRIPKDRRQCKLALSIRKVILVGYTFITKCYRIWVTEINQIIESIGITFNKKAKFESDSSGSTALRFKRQSCDGPGNR